MTDLTPKQQLVKYQTVAEAKAALPTDKLATVRIGADRVTVSTSAGFSQFKRKEWDASA